MFCEEDEESMLTVGQQVKNTENGRSDLTAVDNNGNLVMIEIKRDKKDITHRKEAFEFQAIRYAASCATISDTTELIRDIYAPYVKKHLEEYKLIDSLVPEEIARREMRSFFETNDISEIKNSRFALGKAPEHLTESQQVKLAMIQSNDRQLYRGYLLKESLRMIFKNTDVDKAEADLNHWLWWASHSRIPVFHDLYEKIKRHKEHILNTIRLGLSNARIEATNNKIKLIIRKAYGFRNIQNIPRNT